MKLASIKKEIETHPFIPGRFTHHQFQMLASSRGTRNPGKTPQPKHITFTLTDGTVLFLDAYWQRRKTHHPTLFTVHGVGGSSKTFYIRGITYKAYAQGFNIININLRSCGGTEHLTPTYYNAGQSHDIHEVVTTLIKKKKLNEAYILGVSLGGNIVLKLAGEYGNNPPLELKGIAALSPMINIEATSKCLDLPKNRLYRERFLRTFRERIKKKAAYFPELELEPFAKITTFRAFTEAFIPRFTTYKNGRDYHRRGSAQFVMKDIRIPTLIIHAEDDPIIPLRPLKNVQKEKNPHILYMITKNGGHVGFVSKETGTDADRFWAENRIVEFFQLLRKQ